MQTENLEGQESIFDRDSGSGKMSSVLSQVGGTLKRVKKSLGRIFKKSSKRSSKLKNHTFMLLDLRPGAGNMLGAYWEYDPPWLGSFGTLNTSECPKDAVECSLWQILQATAPSRYSLSQTACLGILRRAACRGKSLPPLLEVALRMQAGLDPPAPISGEAKAYHINQRSEGIDLDGVSGALMATQNLQMQTFIAVFSAGAGASAGTIGYQEGVSPTLKGSPSGNCMPSILCINDQGGQIMECSEDVTGTLRAQEHGHQPLILRPTGPKVYENHGIDGRYAGPHDVAPTMSARYGTGGNNIRQRRLELEKLLQTPPVDEEIARQKAMELAVLTLVSVEMEEYEAHRLRSIFGKQAKMRELDANLLRQSVRKITYGSKTVKVLLKNNQVLEERDNI